MEDIEFRITDERGLAEIRELWEVLNEHHRIRSRYFQDHFRDMTFERRKATLLEKSGTGDLKIIIVKDKGSKKDIGYCIFSLSSKKIGEIDSLCVAGSHRKRGIGTEMCKRAIQWLDESGSIKNIVMVGEGNEEAWNFYRRFGFYPRMTVLEQIQ